MELRQEELSAVQEADEDAQSIERTELLSMRLIASGSTGLAEVTLV